MSSVWFLGAKRQASSSESYSDGIVPMMFTARALCLDVKALAVSAGSLCDDDLKKSPRAAWGY